MRLFYSQQLKLDNPNKLQMELKYKLLTTSGITGLWTLLFLFVNYTVKLSNLSIEKENDTKNRIISIIHGILAFWLCSIALLIQPDLLSHGHSHTANILIQISLSYFIYDTFACFYYKLMDSWLVFHHLVVILALSLSLFGFKGSFYMLVGLSISQISNFPMHMRQIIKNFGLRNTKIYELAENLYFFLYIVARGVISPLLLLLPALTNKRIELIIKLLILAIHLQSYYFIYGMFEIIKRNIARNKEMEQKSIQYEWFTVNKEKLSQLSFFKKE